MARHSKTDTSDTLNSITNPDADSAIWPGATWVGQIEKEHLDCDRLRLVGGEGFRYARLLLWNDDQPRGFIEVDVADGAVDGGRVSDEAANLPEVAERLSVWPLPPITVVVCTKDRPDQLRDAIENLTHLDYPEFELIVVDNNPSSGLTSPVVSSFADSPVRLIEAAGQGLSIARNTAIKAASYDIIAFTDDDVVVDRFWLRSLAYGFARNERVACVCGIVPSAELITPAQSYFDRRVSWARRCEPAMYDLAAPPEDDPLFPLRVAQFGTGANFAVRKDAIVGLGGFDEGMGIGSPTGGGEDIDIFVRFLLAGHKLVREPSAVVWHRHRSTAEELEVQIHNYGLSLGAFGSKLLSRPRTFGMVMRRVRKGVRHLRGITGVVDQTDTIAHDPGLEGLDQRELRGVLKGPAALLRARLSGRNGTPLKTSSSKVIRALNFRRDQMWGEPGNSITAGRLSVAAVALGLIGSLAAVSTLPKALLFVALIAFVLAGPGSLALSWYARLPAVALAALVPTVSLALCVLVVTGLLMLGYYSPADVLVGMTVATVVGGLLRCAYLAHRGVSAR